MNIGLISLALILVLVADVALWATGKLSAPVAAMIGVIALIVLVASTGVV